MSDIGRTSASSTGDDASYSAEDFGHPRGTLVIVLVYALVFVLGWLGLYLFQFLDRGVPQP